MWRFWGRATTRLGMTDEEYVERIRRAEAFWERWRRPVRVTNAVTTVGVVALFLIGANPFKLLVQGNNAQGLLPGFAIGLMLGVFWGLMMEFATRSLLNSQRSWRTERLLLRYHDALAMLAEQSSPLSEQVDEPVQQPSCT
jgi:hypothetical protein